MHCRIVRQARDHKDFYVRVNTPCGTPYLKVYCTLPTDMTCTGGGLVQYPGGYSSKIPEYARWAVENKLAEWDEQTQQM